MTDDPIADGGRDDRSNPSLRFTYEIDEHESPSEAVVRAVAALTNTSSIELDPLYDVIEPGHLDGTFEGTDGRTETELSFEFNGCEVSVTADEVRVSERDGRS